MVIFFMDQLGGLVFSVLFGLCGVPFCWITTPRWFMRMLCAVNFSIQLLRNLVGMLKAGGGKPPSAVSASPAGRAWSL
jgi:hypothetical protein